MFGVTLVNMLLKGFRTFDPRQALPDLTQLSAAASSHDDRSSDGSQHHDEDQVVEDEDTRSRKRLKAHSEQVCLENDLSVDALDVFVGVRLKFLVILYNADCAVQLPSDHRQVYLAGMMLKVMKLREQDYAQYEILRNPELAASGSDLNLV